MKKNKIGLALSGGGFRATIYHLGTLRKLRELGLLDKINVISSNSGGSITAACFSLYYKDFDNFSDIIKNGVRKEITLRILISPRFFIPVLLFLAAFTAGYWSPFQLPPYAYTIIAVISICILFRFQFQLIPISKIIEKRYDKVFFKKKKLKDLSKDFKTTIISTNVETGRLFYFSKQSMSDSTYLHPKADDPIAPLPGKITFKQSDFPISRAVMASSCVPFAFSPISIGKEFFTNEQDFFKIKPKLVDGGVYDNQGIHKLTFIKSGTYCENVIVSDAGNFLPHENWSFNSLFLLTRTSNIFMSRIKNFQMMANLYTINPNSMVAYQSLAFDLNDSIDEFIKMLKSGYIKDQVIKAHNIDQQDIDNKNWEAIKEYLKNKIGYEALEIKGCNADELKIARKVRTGLSALSESKINALMKHAEAITELQVKLFLPHLLNQESA
ncbi:MAG: patatin-like phospholipase family protein [Flavobacterium sp.]